MKEKLKCIVRVDYCIEVTANTQRAYIMNKCEQVTFFPSVFFLQVFILKASLKVGGAAYR